MLSCSCDCRSCPPNLDSSILDLACCSELLVDSWVWLELDSAVLFVSFVSVEEGVDSVVMGGAGACPAPPTLLIVVPPIFFYLSLSHYPTYRRSRRISVIMPMLLGTGGWSP